MTSNAFVGSRVRGSLRSEEGAGIVRIDARFEADRHDVWLALTDPGRLNDWLGDLEGDLRSGRELSARFFATGWEGTLRVEVCERPERLLLLTKSAGEPDCVIEATLAADGEQTTAVFEDRGCRSTSSPPMGRATRSLLKIWPRTSPGVAVAMRERDGRSCFRITKG